MTQTTNRYIGNPLGYVQKNYNGPELDVVLNKRWIEDVLEEKEVENIMNTFAFSLKADGYERKRLKLFVFKIFILLAASVDYGKDFLEDPSNALQNAMKKDALVDRLLEINQENEETKNWLKMEFEKLNKDLAEKIEVEVSKYISRVHWLSPYKQSRQVVIPDERKIALNDYTKGNSYLSEEAWNEKFEAIL